MKVITNTKRNGKLCYVQVKDVLFLARMTGNKRLMQDYLNAINGGKGDNDFIKVCGESYIKAFELCDYIIDFREYSTKDVGINCLINLIKTKAYVVSNEKIDQEGVDHQIEAIRDVISFKRGELDYKIPLVESGRYECISEDKQFVFDSTIIDDCFVLKCINGSSIEDNDYNSFLKECIDSVYSTLYPYEEEKEYSTFITGKVLVLKINNRNNVKKKSLAGRILAKIKKKD